MSELKAPGKSFAISKREVWEAWEKVKANKGAPGVDGCSIGDFEADLKNNLYKIWNRMSSGSYFPPPVLAVEIPKPHGGGDKGARYSNCRGQDRPDGGGQEAGREG
jgi:RNA-directed DNA polymerase